MNAKKHKNKKVNQQPNVNNPQKDDNKIPVNITDSQISQTECETKGESVLGTTDYVVKRVEEQKETEVIAPKKPKRKKGKKKEDKEEECGNEQEQLERPTTTENKTIVDNENVHRVFPEVIPVRKKKNKKKSGEIGEERMPLLEQKIDSIQLEDEIKTECKIDKTNTNLTKIETIEEVKIAKKKNKRKKNRIDSDKSDKSVEIISCTSVFQKLLDADDDKLDDDIKEPDTDLVTKGNNIFVTSKTGSGMKCEENIQKLEQLNPVIEFETPIQQTQKSDSLPFFEDDNKNKNKKENSEPPKIFNPFEGKRNDSQTQLIRETTEIISLSDEITADPVKSPELSSIEEDSMKCKAKIAKPVEKKRKERQEFQIQSSTKLASEHEKDSQPCVEETFEKIDADKVSKGKTEVDNIKTAKNKDKLKETEQDNSHNIKLKEKQTSFKPLCATVTTSDATEQICIEENINKSELVTSPDVVKDELIFETLVPPDFALKSSEDKLNEILNTITEPTDNKEYLKTDSTQLGDKNDKSRKKGKKTPKILINPETFTVTTGLDKETDHIKTSENDDKCSTQSPGDDIEIRSVKADESEGSTCDVTPDIVHPRSTSEHLRDDNNNTIIKEVFEDTLNMPLLSPNIPLIEGSGETPTETPEVIASGIKLVDIGNISTKLGEKTDIKSKMMEVNKDMEELRYSIEKSLAELNALDKNEAISEKQLNEKHELKMNNKNVQKPSDIITRNIMPEHTVNEVTVSVYSEKIQDDATSTEYQNAEKSSAEQKDQPNFEHVNQIDLRADEAIPNNEQIKEDCTDPTPPVCPARKDHKKGKKRKGRQEMSQTTVQNSSSNISTQDEKKEEKSQQNTETPTQKGKQQSNTNEDNNAPVTENDQDYEPIENFEDALTSSADDINKTFEMIVNQMTENSQQELALHKPEINIIAPSEESEKKDVKENPVTPPKNLLGHPNIPVRSNKTDYKKERDKSPDTKQAKVKIKDNVEIETNKESKESQTEKNSEEKRQKKLKDEEYFCQISNCDDFIYKYSFRRVFLQSACHVCKKELIRFRLPCKFCSLVFYCSLKHKDDDWPKHQALCFAVSTIVHIKGQKHIYADARNITGHNYRLLRMQAILACEKVLKRRLIPWEQEVLLYPRMCADVSCREWRQSKLKDCEGCGQISYCTANADHLPKSHQRWCKSYSLYQKLVIYQQTKGRLEPKLPSRVLNEYQLPEKINEVLASMFDEKIDLNDVQYAALTQIATAPLTVAFCHQIYRNKKKYPTIGTNTMSPFTIHVVGAELQFEADVLNKWEIFFLHLRPDVKELRIILIGPDLNPGKLPLDLLGRIRLCETCRQSKRRVVFSFQDKKTYHEYRNGDDFIYPDIVCAFNPSLHRSSVYNGKDPWQSTINALMKLKSPFVITSHTITELQRDLIRLKEFSELEVIVDPRPNPFSSVRPDRNFISDDEVPLLFKNHCFMIILGV